MTSLTLGLLRVLVAAAGLLPWLYALLGEHSAGLAASFHGLCHQLPERTLVVGETAMLVCSRCAGIYAGLALGGLLPALPFLRRHGRAVVFASGVLMLADVLAQHFGTIPIWHPSRLVTGFLFGVSVSAFVVAVLVEELSRKRRAHEPRHV